MDTETEERRLSPEALLNDWDEILLEVVAAGVFLPMKRAMKGPPVHWVMAQHDEGETAASILVDWVLLTKWQRFQIRGGRGLQLKENAARRANGLKAAEIRVRAGIMDPKTLAFVARGGTRRHASHKAAYEMRAEEKREASRRRSSELLSFLLLNATGCIIAGCALGPSLSFVHQSLLQFDHRDGESKVGCVSSLKGEARAKEILKTDCKCLWHHFEHTRRQLGYRPVMEMKLQLRTLGLMKESAGCQHPCHSQMPYVSLVPNAADDPLMYGFLDVSHINRGGNHRKKGGSQHVAHLISSLAVVHCKFCHELYTDCEKAKLHDTPLVQHKFEIILKTVPSFVHHFEVATAGFDRTTERARISAKQSASLRKRKRDTHAAEINATDEEKDPKKHK